MQHEHQKGKMARYHVTSPRDISILMLLLVEHSTWHYLEHPRKHRGICLLPYMALHEETPAKQPQCCCRRLGLQWVSTVDDLLSVRKALATGLFANAAQYISTTVESRDKEHTGIDLYHLVRSTGNGQPLSSLDVFTWLTALSLLLMGLRCFQAPDVGASSPCCCASSHVQELMLSFLYTHFLYTHFLYTLSSVYMGCHGQSVYYLLAGTLLHPAKA